jgi:hypothetical protein
MYGTVGTVWRSTIALRIAIRRGEDHHVVSYAAHEILKRLLGLIVESKLITRCFLHTLCECDHGSLAMYVQFRDLRDDANTMIPPTIEGRTAYNGTTGAA